MGALTGVASTSAFVPAHVQQHPRHGDRAAPHADAARPSRIGGAPLSGARAVSAYERTAAVDALHVVSRIDEVA